MNFTPLTLAKALSCPLARAEKWYEAVQYATEVYEIDTTLNRLADFLAQIGHESGGLLYVVELWGPTLAQKLYERSPNRPWVSRDPFNFKAFDLGNFDTGDGFRFRGRGPLQVTGRKNARLASERLRLKFGDEVPDFEKDPRLMELPKWGMLTAGDFWDRTGLNALADSGDFRLQTKRINGGYTHLAQRLTRRAAARLALV